jgi:hypothetical protein
MVVFNWAIGFSGDIGPVLRKHKYSNYFNVLLDGRKLRTWWSNLITSDVLKVGGGGRGGGKHKERERIKNISFRFSYLFR